MKNYLKQDAVLDLVRAWTQGRKIVGCRVDWPTVEAPPEDGEWKRREPGPDIYITIKLAAPLFCGGSHETP
jgi:hypothetical protein